MLIKFANWIDVEKFGLESKPDRVHLEGEMAGKRNTWEGQANLPQR